MVDVQSSGGNQFHNQRQHREAMARNKPPTEFAPRADDPHSQWDDASWDHDLDEDAGDRARRLLSKPTAGIHHVGDRVSALRGRMSEARWIKRLAFSLGVLVLFCVICFGALWWRVGA